MDKASREALPPLPPRPAMQRQSATARLDGGGGEDEQVEKFYALLDNIRAERHLFKSQGSCKKKRPRREEPPWRPTFTLQDFEEAKGDQVGGSANKFGEEASGNGEKTSGNGDMSRQAVVEEVDLRLTLSLG
uniref:Uncharacterized protein n=1 Tax=Arundo donax TaxID=35708 RepID=A0A0A9AZE0_ARUDO